MDGFEAAILYGYMFFGEGILTLFFQGTNGLWKKVRLGQFDQYLTRPISLELQFMERKQILQEREQQLQG